jgi:UDP-N-acetylenolpyruvoylglucosamine reductase
MSAALEMPTHTQSCADELARRVSSATVIRRDEPLARRTTLRVGGPADIYVEPANENDLSVVLKFCGERGLKFFVLGRGSNLLVRDGGVRGVVICLAQAHFSRIEISGTGILPVRSESDAGNKSAETHRQDTCATKIVCGAGAKLKNVSVEARRAGLAGLEFLEGIPGSVGGALRMNAGAMSGETFNVVESVRVMDLNGTVHEMTPTEMSVAYRSCATLKTNIALSAVLRGQRDSIESITQRMSAYSQKRWASQPAAPSAGCAFKNPATIPAGRLIEELGLKGTRIGGAMVSMEHGNFIVNDGTATARDVLRLIELIRQRAKAERGIELHTEVEIIGDEI